MKHASKVLKGWSHELLLKAAEKYGTPTYLYSSDLINERVGRLISSIKHVPCDVHYAVKANSNINVLRIINSLGCGADIVSGGELFRCLKAGFSASKIVFSGVGKTNEELKYAIDSGVYAFNIESVSELLRLNELSQQANKVSIVRFRINPNVDAKTHPYISTGLKKNKFGLSHEELRIAYGFLPEMNHIRPSGLSCHIGSQILDVSPLLQAWRSMLKTASKAPFPVTELDLGGGFGISYSPSEAANIKTYGQAIAGFYKQLPIEIKRQVRLSVEPGRSLVGEAGLLLSKVVCVKKRGSKLFIVLDAGMNDLMRPALYGAHHQVVVVSSKTPSKQHSDESIIVGPVCESADTFWTYKNSAVCEEGDLVALTNAGAYGMSMASRYNSRPLPAEVLLSKSGLKLLRKRESLNDLIKHEESTL
jgi:diaminopimelate decarboxylase